MDKLSLLNASSFTPTEKKKRNEKKRSRTKLWVFKTQSDCSSPAPGRLPPASWERHSVLNRLSGRANAYKRNCNTEMFLNLGWPLDKEGSLKKERKWSTDLDLHLWWRSSSFCFEIIIIYLYIKKKAAFCWLSDNQDARPQALKGDCDIFLNHGDANQVFLPGFSPVIWSVRSSFRIPMISRAKNPTNT